MRDFRKLIAWQKAHALALDVHQSVMGLRGVMPAHCRNQLERAIASIPANIAEGSGKRSEIEFSRYLDIALGSAKECENHLLFARDMQYFDEATYAALETRLAEVGRIVFGLNRAVRARIRDASAGGSGKGAGTSEKP
ncbi:four helix bundle protein [soil metagenome]